jgi:chromosome segregation ATPase
MDETKAQVDQALGRLEAAVEAIGQRAAEREAQLAKRLEAARQEAAAAQAAAAAAKAESEGLKSLLAQTSGRLDQAIERLQGLLAKASGE